MQFWLLASTLLVVKKTSPALWKVKQKFLTIWYLSLCVLGSLNIFFYSEICSVANGATKKEIGRAKEFIVKQLEVEMGQSMEMGTIHAGDFLVSLMV